MKRLRLLLRPLLVAILALAALALGRSFWPVPAATRAAWVADLDLLEAHTAAAYANLADRLRSRELAPRELDQEARTALARARTASEARAALTAFVEAFDDHHFRAEAPYSAPRRWLRRMLGKDRAQESGAIPWTASGAEACARFGARDRREGRIDWGALPGYDALAADPVSHPFPAGILRRAGAAPLGILRIGLFSQQGFPQLCAAEWERVKAARAGAVPPEVPPAEGAEVSAACDDTCQEAFWAGLEERLLDRFAAELAELAEGGATALLVDLSDNGGGSGIVGRMVSMVTSRPLPERAGGFIRHPHSVARFTAMAADYAAEVSRPELPARQRELYARVQAQLEAAAREAAAPCDLAAMWQLASAAELPCANVGRVGPGLDPAEQAELAELEALETGGSRRERPAAWTGELFVVTNRRTASASEDFVASLQDAGAARIVGETTMGIGCGYTNGGVTLTLPATDLTVRAPDCIRYRRDGRNEAEGVLPDLPVEWNDDDSGQARAEKLVVALRER